MAEARSIAVYASVETLQGISKLYCRSVETGVTVGVRGGQIALSVRDGDASTCVYLSVSEARHVASLLERALRGLG